MSEVDGDRVEPYVRTRTGTSFVRWRIGHWKKAGLVVVRVLLREAGLEATMSDEWE